MDVFILLTISLLVPLSTAVQSCSWRMKNMIRNGGPLVPVRKPAVVRSAMHCVHLCISTRRCDAVQFTTSSCTMYSVGFQSVSDTKQSSVFHVKKAIWPEKFISKQTSKRKGYEADNVVKKMKTSSLSSDDVEPTLSTEMTSVVAPVPKSTTPCPQLIAENSSLPVRNITQAQCSKHEGFTYLSKVSMCVMFCKYTNYKGGTWMEARSRCWDKGGDLVGMKSRKEHLAIHRYLKTRGYSGRMILTTGRGIWIGLQIHPYGGRWTDNTPLTYNKRMETFVKTTQCVDVELIFTMMVKAKCNSRKRRFLCEIT